MLTNADDTLPENQNGEDKMAIARCAKCDVYNDDPTRRDDWRNPEIIIRHSRAGWDSAQISLRGVLTCVLDGHRWPIQMRDSSLQETAKALPSTASASLNPQVPDSICQDMEEAEEAHFYQLYKSSVIMCRRALQLGIETKPNAPQDRTLGPLLAWGRQQSPPLLTTATDALAEGIQEYGNIGAHRVEHIPPETASMVIHITVTA